MIGGDIYTEEILYNDIKVNYTTNIKFNQILIGSLYKISSV